ncbi:PREDICTED: leucine-rich repeat and immunoglobulin-like domain containing-NOGO receptor-interacting protein 4 [Nanorana parkeri]|uniref:leucine-rich repeat and immunoglobulin-like domain containing-NOGO receptor-interacting protein 4 n=1 Tax=Nanorana parkeri TaxID=125878 RepID=UPI000854940C|nr:PREDICTED: leucine-rich repeat and immunoglobulin-like domain containing-NOGO receptor-interacting protein 4 [Nanorana parkeri]
METRRYTQRLNVALKPAVLLVTMGVLLIESGVCCPPSCDCPSHDNATLCKRRLLSLVPSEIPRSSHFLDLSYNRIRSVQHGTFLHLQDLQELDLSHNQLTRIEPGAFDGLAKLRVLLAHHNQLKLLPPGVFLGMPGLNWLDVRANQLVILLDQTFRGLQELRHLEVGDNPLLFISPAAFKGMPLLQRLGLEKTKLGSVPSQALAALPQLSELRLGGVTSTVLRDLSFSDMPSLRVLDMDYWPSLAHLGAHSLTSLNLTSLSLTNCNLSSVPEEALRSQVHLRRLDLSQNPISFLTGKGFSALKRLEVLRLSSGRLGSIPSNAFQGLDHLRMLDLSDNPIRWVEDNALPPPGVLETLLLSETNLSCDCRLCWLLHHQIQFGGRPPVCSAPDSLKGMVIPDHSELLCPEFFTCQPPRITERGPRELRVQEGGRLTLSCQSHGVPEPFMLWVLPQVPQSVDNKSTQLEAPDTELPQPSTGPVEVTKSAQLVADPPSLSERMEGRITTLPEGSLQFLPVRMQDAGDYLCLATNLAGNDSVWIHLEVIPFNGSATFTALPMLHSHLLVVITAGGILPFISSVTLCFIFIFLWSRGRGNIKHTANIDYIPRTSRGTSSAEDNKFTMKLI